MLASQRRLEAAENDGEAEKIKRTKSAQASAAATMITAGGIAESRSIIAEGNAKALAAFRADTTLADNDAMTFMMDINRLEGLRDAATHGGRTVLVAGEGGGDMASKALLGALAPELEQPANPVMKEKRAPASNPVSASDRAAEPDQSGTEPAT